MFAEIILVPSKLDFASQCKEEGLTTELVHMDKLRNMAGLGDAEHRGPKWYDGGSSESDLSDSYMKSDSDTSSSLSSSSVSITSSSEASSEETKERKRIDKVYRTCTPCPHDMMKKYKNLGIKWICASYQRARRTFKSECMMRYRNCQDGTLFVKIHEYKCKNDSYHGRHWFYVYKT